MMGKMRNQAGYRANSTDISAPTPKLSARDAGLMDELLHGETTRIFAGMAGRFLVRLGRMFVLGLAIGAFLWLVGALTPAHGAANDVIGQPDSPEQADLAEQPQCRMSWTEVRGHRTGYTFKYYPDLWIPNPETHDLGVVTEDYSFRHSSGVMDAAIVTMPAPMPDAFYLGMFTGDMSPFGRPGRLVNTAEVDVHGARFVEYTLEFDNPPTEVFLSLHSDCDSSSQVMVLLQGDLPEETRCLMLRSKDAFLKGFFKESDCPHDFVGAPAAP